MTPNTNFVGQHIYNDAFQNKYRAHPPTHKNFTPNQSFVDKPFNNQGRTFPNTPNGVYDCSTFPQQPQTSGVGNFLYNEASGSQNSSLQENVLIPAHSLSRANTSTKASKPLSDRLRDMSSYYEASPNTVVQSNNPTTSFGSSSDENMLQQKSTGKFSYLFFIEPKPKPIKTINDTFYNIFFNVSMKVKRAV